jgi:formylglycine-generating enzyme required for sulfatase activity
MKTTKLRKLYLSIFICVFVFNILMSVSATQTIPGVQRLSEGIAAYEHGEYDDVIFNLEMVLNQISNEDKESLWKTHFYLGLSYCLTGNSDEARKQFSAAQEIIKSRLPDPVVHSPKIVKMFNDANVRIGSGASGAFRDSNTGMEFVLVKGGCYEMGDTFGDGDKDENPVHEVCLDDFYIGKYEVTQGQWEEVMGSNPSRFENGSNYPVERVSWNDIQGFIRMLNNKTGIKYRLPTEAEWEYAARSGGKSEKYAGTSKKLELGRYAWYDDNSDSKTHPVGQKKPNGLGLYDMTGNVDEWCQDIYSKKAYSKHQRNNPIYKESGSFRVLRGGSWNVSPRSLRASHRRYITPDSGYDILGFRLAGTP